MSKSLLLLGMILFTAIFGSVYAYGQETSLEIEQLQAQVDVMLEEMGELQGYRICGERGMVYQPRSKLVDSEGCLPTLQAPKEPLQAPFIAGQNKPLAKTARSFNLGRFSKQKDTPLFNMAQPEPVKNIKPVKALSRVASKEAEEIGYPNDKVKALIEMAVSQALGAAKKGRNLPPSAINVPVADVTPHLSAENTQKNKKALQQSIAALVPSCREGEFLTMIDGKVMCQRAVHANKLSCSPAVLRTYVDWYSKHVHFHISYTLHGQTNTAEKFSHKGVFECNNGKYKLLELTRNECGGAVCKKGRKPAYSLTYYCNEDKTNRCYIKKNGHLVNHTFTEATLPNNIKTSGLRTFLLCFDLSFGHVGLRHSLALHSATNQKSDSASRFKKGLRV